MSQILEKILNQIPCLSSEEIAILMTELNKQIERADKIRLALQRVRGKGQGVWQQDAQEFINQIRTDERF